MAPPTSPPVLLHPTPESIAAAKYAQLLERAAVTAQTGLTFDAYDRIALSIADAIQAAVYGVRPESQHGR